MTRKILHLDLDAFYCAVEEQRDPTLADKPFAVGGRPDQRGVVSSCSYAARRFGVRSAMPMARALRLCPELLVTSPSFKAYSLASRQVMERLRGMTPLVEQISIDEAFLDLSEQSEPAEEMARRLQTEIRQELKLPCSLGVASNKLVAKIANDFGKAAAQSYGPPNAITIVPPGQEAEFLALLPVEALWGVGPKTAERLEELGVLTIGDLAQWPPQDLERRFGKIGPELSLRARGIDQRPIVTHHEPKSFSQERTFDRDVRDSERLQTTLHELTQGVCRQLRKSDLAGRTVKLKLRWPDFTTFTRQTTLPGPSEQEDEIYAAVLRLFDKSWRTGKAVRLIGVGVSGLGPPVRQLSLWDYAANSGTRAEDEKARQLQEAVDILRRRFGDQVIQPGSAIQPKNDAPNHQAPQPGADKSLSRYRGTSRRDTSRCDTDQEGQ